MDLHTTALAAILVSVVVNGTMLAWDSTIRGYNANLLALYLAALCIAFLSCPIPTNIVQMFSYENTARALFPAVLNVTLFVGAYCILRNMPERD